MYQPDIYHASVHIPISESKVHVTSAALFSQSLKYQTGDLRVLFSLRIKHSSIFHIPSTRIGILVTALRANQPVYAYLSEDRRLFVRAGQKWWEQELWPSSVPLIHKQSGRHPSNRRNSLKRARKPTSIFSSDESDAARGKCRRRETRCLPHLSLHPQNTHQSSRVKTGGRREARSVERCCFASRYDAGSHCAVCWMGPNIIGMSSSRAAGLS